MVDSLLGRDEYLTLADYRAYVDCQDDVDEAWRDTDRWTRMSMLNTARSGFFSSDRTVRDYWPGSGTSTRSACPDELSDILSLR